MKTAATGRITGLNPAFGGLLTNVSLAGTFAMSGPRLLSDNLKIRSDKLNATAVVVADLQRGIYQGGIQGRVNNYRLEGIGLLDVPGVVAVQLFVRDVRPVVDAPVQGDVDGIPEGSHPVLL